MKKDKNNSSTGLTFIEIVVVVTLLILVVGVGIVVQKGKTIPGLPFVGPQETTFIPSGLKPSEFCKAYVSVSILNPVELTANAIDFDLKNTGSTVIIGLNIEVEGKLTGLDQKREEKKPPPPIIKIAGIETSSKEFTITGIGTYQTIQLSPNQVLNASLPVEATNVHEYRVSAVEVTPIAQYQGSKILCPDSQVEQAGTDRYRF